LDLIQLVPESLVTPTRVLAHTVWERGKRRGCNERVRWRIGFWLWLWLWFWFGFGFGS